MRSLLTIPALLLLIVFSGCSTSNKSTGVWVNKEKIQGKSYNSVFIVVMSADMDARNTLETDLAAAATAKGYKAIKSVDVMPPSLSNPSVPEKEEIVSKEKASGCNAVFVASLLKKEEDIRYVPGAASYSPLPYYTWSGNYHGYYRHWYPTLYSSGYYEQNKTYFMQGNLYDVASEEIMWSVQSEIFNPSSIKKFSSSYTKKLVKQLEKEGLLKR